MRGVTAPTLKLARVPEGGKPMADITRLARNATDMVGLAGGPRGIERAGEREGVALKNAEAVGDAMGIGRGLRMLRTHLLLGVSA